MNPYSSDSLNAYRKTQVENAAPGELLLQLMEAAIRHAKQARVNGTAGETVPAREHALKTLDIVMELDNTLDRENGGEVVEDLEALYAFLEREIGDAQIKAEFERFADVEEILQNLYQGWKDAVAQAQNSEAQQPEGA